MLGSYLGGFDTRLVNELRRLEVEMDQLLSGGTAIRSAGRGAFPPINVGSTPERVDIYLFAAGIDPKKLEVSIQRNLLTVAGNRSETAQADAAYYRRERFEGDFRRVLTLPEDVDPMRVDAKYRDGVVHITVQRREAARPRQIAVH